MKFLFLIFFSTLSFATEIPVLVLSDTVNPGTGEYLIRGIERAERAKAPFLVMEVDTPGGLLQTTRLIVQKMLSSSIPIVVFVGPKGAHAGSAGALITFAADVAAMAPGTNIGAAHPVATGGEKIDDTMAKKLANDVAAFAESLAKTKGRNTDWAIKAVHESAALSADEALSKGVIDLMADNVDELLQKISGHSLKVAKKNMPQIPVGTFSARMESMSISQHVVSFLADPNLAYLIMTLGGICIWVELSHPGLIFPGILGAICIIVSLVSFQELPIHYGALAMIFLGMGLLATELYFPAYGVLGVGGVISFILGSLFLMDTSAPEFQISLSLILPTAACLVAFIVILSLALMRTRRAKKISGVDGLIGAMGTVKEAVGPSSGKIFLQGELWNAVTAEGSEIPVGKTCRVTAVRNMLLVVTEAI